ncbi:branched-chain amino acid ABC transporter permease [Bordetella bronchiseptica]
MTVDLVLLQLFTGLALGAIYVLLAVGLSLIFGMLTVVNFGHGAFFMLGAYAGVVVLDLTQNFWAAMLLAPLAVAAVGMVCERWLIRPLYGRGIDYPLLLTFGLAYMLVEAVRMLFGRAGLPFDTPEALAGFTNLGFADFPTYRLFIIAVTIVLLLALWLLIEKTAFGLIVRAGARDPVIVRVLGIDVSRVWLLVFGLGTGIAALAGVLAAPLQGVSPEMGTSVLIVAFVVTVVGGMGSLMGAVVAGLLVGVAESMSVLFFPEAAKVSMFVIMAAVLLWRPQGLFGRSGLLA